MNGGPGGASIWIALFALGPVIMEG